MKWSYLIVSLVCFGMVMCGYEVERASLLLFASSIGFNSHDRIDQLKRDNNLK